MDNGAGPAIAGPMPFRLAGVPNGEGAVLVHVMVSGEDGSVTVGELGPDPASGGWTAAVVRGADGPRSPFELGPDATLRDTIAAMQAARGAIAEPAAAD